MPSKAALQVLVSLLVAVILAVGVTLGVQQIMRWREGAIQNEQKGRTMASASDITAQGDASAAARNDADTAGVANRENFNSSVEEAQRNEPETAVRDAGAVPASRLRAFESRRLERERIARERLGRAGVQREEGSGSQEATER